MTSIRQNPADHRVPDFRNLGVMLRVLLGVNFMALVAVLLQVRNPAAWPGRYVELAAWVEPLLFSSLLLLAMLRDLLWRLSYRAALVAVLFLSALQAAMLQDFMRFMGLADGQGTDLLRSALLAALAAAGMLFYFHLRASSLSPAIAEARVQALTARIRPHFMFNTLNAVLSLIRAEPRRAEQALEELADLFRALMRDHRQLVPIADEIALCRQYLDLEKLRLGDRLQVEWIIENLPGELHVPPLLLQPLLENAVYHGIEPALEQGLIRIRFSRRGSDLAIELENPVGSKVPQSGNRMALANIRERLALYYDLEASLEAGEVNGIYKVTMVLPCRN